MGDASLMHMPAIILTHAMWVYLLLGTALVSTLFVLAFVLVSDLLKYRRDGKDLLTDRPRGRPVVLLRERDMEPDGT
jgi:hypothetical protein